MKRFYSITAINLIKKIKALHFNQRSREAFVFLFFLFISFCFWLMQTLKNNFETIVQIPIELVNIPDSVTITKQLSSPIAVSIKDRGTLLAHYRFIQHFKKIAVDFRKYENNSSYVRLSSKLFTSQISSQLSASTFIVTIAPDSIAYAYSKSEGKKVPVRFNGSIGANEPVVVTDTLFDPDSVLIYAPPSLLATIQQVVTEPVSFLEVKETVLSPVKIQEIENVRIIPSTVNLTIGTDLLTEKIVAVPIVGVNFPADKVLHSFPAVVQVKFKVPMRSFKNVSSDNFSVVLDYNDIKKDPFSKVPLQLLSYPKHLLGIQLIPNRVEYVLDQVAFE